MADASSPRRTSGIGMSSRLLLLTVFFVMLSEVLIYAPSIARFRKTYLEERVARAHLATLALADAPEWSFGPDLEKKLLENAEVHGVAIIRDKRRVLAIEGDIPPVVDDSYELTGTSWMMWIFEAFETLARTDNRALRVVGPAPRDGGVLVEVVLDEGPMREAMLGYSTRILQLSIMISLFTAGLVYLSLQWLLVRPIRRIISSMIAFRADPEGDAATAIAETGRADEIGLAQRELAVMQNQVQAALRQKSRLAALGSAVAKINHDLRNSLATAMLVSDHLANIDDPQVKQVLPRLYTAVDRAVDLCTQTLDYARDPVGAMKPVLFHLHELVAEAGADLRESEIGGRAVALDWVNGVDPELDVVVDRAQFFRVFKNLGRNAFEAGATRCVVTARVEEDRLIVEIADDGPGLAEKARETLFKPFATSTRAGGTGLGLAIVFEIVKAHGGAITVAATGESGTTFRIALPRRP